MRWKNIKTVMIVILLAVNVWLIYLLAGPLSGADLFRHRLAAEYGGDSGSG